ncbi:hypothetical protein OROMI_008746 [Orobanche minor]
MILPDSIRPASTKNQKNRGHEFLLCYSTGTLPKTTVAPSWHFLEVDPFSVSFASVSSPEASTAPPENPEIELEFIGSHSYKWREAA